MGSQIKKKYTKYCKMYTKKHANKPFICKQRSIKFNIDIQLAVHYNKSINIKTETMKRRKKMSKIIENGETCYSIYLREEMPEEEVAELNTILNKVGARMSTYYENDNYFLYIFCSADEMHKTIGRNAGAKRKYLKNDVKVSEIRDRMAMGETVEQIAKSLGISRATLFRRLKECDQEHSDVIL